MARGGRELFPRDRGLQARMALAALVSLILTGVLVGGLVRVALLMEEGWAYAVAAFAIFGVTGAVSTRRARELRDRRERGAEAHDRVEGIVQRLAVLADLPAPRVEIDPVDAPQCWTTERLLGGATITATAGLAERLDEDELTAVIAHELSHLANGDALVMTLLGGPPTWIVQGVKQVVTEAAQEVRLRLLIVATIYGSFALALALPGLLAARILARHRELAADRGAAILTGSPAALASALRRLSGELGRIPRNDLRTVGGGDLFYVLPSRREPSGPARLWATHPRLATRIERLEEMERRLVLARPVLDPG
ncbi:MAG TPA: M48 family metalloprotease [Thermoleophilaceae bacterium]